MYGALLIRALQALHRQDHPQTTLSQNLEFFGVGAATACVPPGARVRWLTPRACAIVRYLRNPERSCLRILGPVYTELITQADKRETGPCRLPSTLPRFGFVVLEHNKDAPAPAFPSGLFQVCPQFWASQPGTGTGCCSRMHGRGAGRFSFSEKFCPRARRGCGFRGSPSRPILSGLK